MDDFDFLHGSWDVANRRLTTPLGSGPGTWVEFPGHAVVQPRGVSQVRIPPMNSENADRFLGEFQELEHGRPDGPSLRAAVRDQPRRPDSPQGPETPLP
ncbi:hypothetical protein [Streptomyces sp. NPDC056661]|uniref:hypothetical protein n=1 Tax=Streptomyces sp. NPDC056661 TaxID=3345898 RepID=UPI0036B8F4F1